MPAKEFDGELFHATGGKPYVLSPSLQIGERIEIGQSHNPFFIFYERTRTEPVHFEDRIEHFPAINFLHNVKDGKLNCPNLPIIAYNIAKHFQMLSRELVYESVRLEIDRTLPSRQSCLWASYSVEQAADWARRCGANSIAKIHVAGRIFEADAALLMADSEPLSTTIARANRYWRGHLSENPELELLIVGHATVLEILPLTAP
jgi:Protein of unknown function (DUF2441)